MKLLALTFVLFVSHFISLAQNGWGYQFGASFSFGTKVNRIGMRASAFYFYDFAEVNVSVNGYYNLQSYALKQKCVELQPGLGVVFSAGNRLDSTFSNPFVGLTETHTNRPYQLGYAMLFYLDNQKTTQSTGQFSLGAYGAKIVTENDIFGLHLSGGRDKFRTAAVQIEYRYQYYKWAISTVLWTGDFKHSLKVKDSDYPSRFGYYADKNSVYGSYSLGLLSAQMDMVLPYGQTARVNFGVDSEKWRHRIQNQWMHDQYFLNEKRIKYPQIHIPMRDENGNAYLFHDGQHIKKPTLFFNVGLNNMLFY